jgi:hypothetical protein
LCLSTPAFQLAFHPELWLVERKTEQGRTLT